MLDLNGFKQINDTFGHRVGDQVLVEVAHRLRAQARAGQVPARLSGDEFAVWLGSFRDDRAQWLAMVADIRRLSLVISLPMRIERHRLVVTASIGAGIKPAKPARLAALLEPADRAMYRGKKPRRSGLAFSPFHRGVFKSAAPDFSPLPVLIARLVAGGEDLSPVGAEETGS